MYRPRRSSRRWRASATAAALCAVLVACEPAGDPQPDAAATPTTAEGAALGAPAAAGLPASLAQLREESATSAAQWQTEPVLASMAVDVDEDGAWTRASATYLAADADRMFEHVVTTDGTTTNRPTLATLGLDPIPGDALAEVPEPPADVTEPAALVAEAQPGLEACEAAGRPDSVLYATGAPVAWDGDRWTQQLRWTATVGTDEGGAIVLDPVSGEQLPGQSCVPSGAPSPQQTPPR